MRDPAAPPLPGELVTGPTCGLVVPQSAVLDDVDDAFVHDLEIALTTLIYGLLGRYGAGELDITDILPTRCSG